MRFEHKYVDFRISRRTLWIGMRAYPLHNVTQVRPLECKVNHRAAVIEYGRRAAAWSGLGLAGLVVLGCLGQSVPAGVSVIFVASILGMLVLHTVRLVRRLNMPKLYALSVNTSGDPRAALISTNKDLIYGLTRRVVDAIDNPAMEFAIQVDHIETIYGDKVGGDKIDGDKIDGGKFTFEGWQ